MHDTQKFNRLVQNLKRCPGVISHSSGVHNEADTLAHALLNMQSSFKMIEELISRLTRNDIEEHSIDKILFDIGLQVDHILYCINDTRYYWAMNNDD